MNIAKKIANRKWDEIASATTRTTNRSGLSKPTRRAKRKANRRAIREENRIAFNDAA